VAEGDFPVFEAKSYGAVVADFDHLGGGDDGFARHLRSVRKSPMNLKVGMEDTVYEIRPIGWMRTPWKEKFGVPRQPGLVNEAIGEVEFAEEFGEQEAREGLEGFSHLWVTFVFDQVKEENTRLRVRPPRLGGNEKRGVFATRSPFRPNRLGLSLCEIAEVWPILKLRGVDLVDGTPIVDLRPYVPYADCALTARAGFAADPPEKMEVDISLVEEVWASLSGEEQRLLRGMLALDPRPAYQDQEEREYGVRVGDWEVKWRVDGARVLIMRMSSTLKLCVFSEEKMMVLKSSKSVERVRMRGKFGERLETKPKFKVGNPFSLKSILRLRSLLASARKGLVPMASSTPTEVPSRSTSTSNANTLSRAMLKNSTAP